MRRFSSPEKQGRKQSGAAMRRLQKMDRIIRSVGSVRVYEQGLRNIATRLARDAISLGDLTPELLTSYLYERSEEVRQKTLDIDRQAGQILLWHDLKNFDLHEKIPVIKSELETILESRAYTPEQVDAITAHQQPQNALATEIAYTAGLRAHELLTLQPSTALAMDARPVDPAKFDGMEGVRYSVVGKGGLVREVVIPSHLAHQLEQRRLETPCHFRDRTVNYTKHYDLSGGKNWSTSFSRASQSVLTWSTGAHGLRHSYAQERMDYLRDHQGMERESALRVVSQEMGHFRPEITEVYLR